MRTLFILIGTMLFNAVEADACLRVSKVDPEEVVAQADLIVRVTAIDYVEAPSDPDIMVDGRPDSIVRFQVEEQLKGDNATGVVELHACLRNHDDYNDRPVPYDFVRPNGRRGSCYANTYRPGAQYLLFLRLIDGVYTTDWYPLGPTNEQLKPSDDPWLAWVKERVRKRVKGVKH